MAGAIRSVQIRNRKGGLKATEKNLYASMHNPGIQTTEWWRPGRGRKSKGDQ